MAAPAVANWQAQILKGVGAPVTPQNLVFVNDWARAEGGGATNNPFNTTQGAPGASSYNSVGVRNYGSPQQGIQATVQTLQNGRYGPIIAALQQGSSARSAAQALAASPWGTGSLVLKMLGGGQRQPQPQPQGGPVGQGPVGVAPQQRQAGPQVNPHLLQILLATREAVGLPAPGQALTQQFAQALQPRPLPVQRGAVAPIAPIPAATTGPPTRNLAAVDGIQVDPRVAPLLEQLVNRFHVSPTSGYRSPAHNREVGGAPNSDHLRGDAVDFSGTPQELAALYRYAQGRFPYVEPMAQAKNHVHISFARP